MPNSKARKSTACPQATLGVCVTCLAAKRALFSLNATPQLVNICNGLTLSTADTVCYECRAMLSNFARFRNRAQRAKKFLSSIPPTSHLSQAEILKIFAAASGINCLSTLRRKVISHDTICADGDLSRLQQCPWKSKDKPMETQRLDAGPEVMEDVLESQTTEDSETVEVTESVVKEEDFLEPVLEVIEDYSETQNLEIEDTLDFVHSELVTEDVVKEEEFFDLELGDIDKVEAEELLSAEPEVKEEAIEYEDDPLCVESVEVLNSLVRTLDVEPEMGVEDGAALEVSGKRVRLPLTAANRMRRYREKLKLDPERYEEYKRKHAKLVKERTKKITELPDQEKEKLRKVWREQKQMQKRKKTDECIVKICNTSEVSLPLTPAERVRRYREKLKLDPERYEEYKRKNARLVKESRKKITELPDQEKEKLRKVWREQKQMQKKKNPDECIVKICNTSEVRLPLTAANRMRRYREKLKLDPERYEEYKRKHAKLVKERTKKITELPDKEKEKLRKRWREQKQMQKRKKNR